jgi:hypothetical protein
MELLREGALLIEGLLTKGQVLEAIATLMLATIKNQFPLRPHRTTGMRPIVTIPWKNRICHHLLPHRLYSECHQ